MFRRSLLAKGIHKVTLRAEHAARDAWCCNMVTLRDDHATRRDVKRQDARPRGCGVYPPGRAPTLRAKSLSDGAWHVTGGCSGSRKSVSYL